MLHISSMGFKPRFGNGSFQYTRAYSELLHKIDARKLCDDWDQMTGFDFKAVQQGNHVTLTTKPAQYEVGYGLLESMSGFEFIDAPPVKNGAGFVYTAEDGTCLNGIYTS